MLPKEFRLKINQARTKAWVNKKEFYTPVFKIVQRFANPHASPKIGFIVSGKTGKAAERNRARRLLCEAIRERLEKFPAGSEFLIIAGKRAAEADYEEISTFLDQVLPKIHRGR